MTTPTFTKLLDWVDGRLDDLTAAKISAHVISSQEAACRGRLRRGHQDTDLRRHCQRSLFITS